MNNPALDAAEAMAETYTEELRRAKLRAFYSAGRVLAQRLERDESDAIHERIHFHNDEKFCAALQSVADWSHQIGYERGSMNPLKQVRQLERKIALQRACLKKRIRALQRSLAAARGGPAFEGDPATCAFRSDKVPPPATEVAP